MSALSPALVGLEVAPVTQAIDARWLMAYAAALGEADPRYFDTEAAAGPLAHPLFSVCYEWPAVVAAREAIDAALRPRSVHATHRVEIHRHARAGDRLTTTARVTAVEPCRAGTRLDVRVATRDAAGQPVTTTEYGSIFLGVGAIEQGTGARPDALDDRDSRRAADEPPREIAAGPQCEPQPQARRARDLGRGDSPGARALYNWQSVVDVPATLGHVYTECARIWNPIHTDVAVARAAGLPAPILHGTATLALAVSRVVARELDGNPAAVRRIEGRFTGMVALPSRFTVRGGGRRGAAILFDAVGADGRPVLSRGVLSR